MNDVTLAMTMAAKAHSHQVDKLGAPYISHPERVAANFDPVQQPEESCVAWLHDVFEDTPLTASDLTAAGFSPEVVEAVSVLTRRSEVPTELYYARIRENPIALAVKLADVADNSAPWRTAQLDPETRERLAAKYAKAREALGVGAE
ncbi:MAG TPA: HD domain-containing protein [Galbitalea sp.]